MKEQPRSTRSWLYALGITAVLLLASYQRSAAQSALDVTQGELVKSTFGVSSYLVQDVIQSLSGFNPAIIATLGDLDASYSFEVDGGNTNFRRGPSVWIDAEMGTAAVPVIGGYFKILHMGVNSDWHHTPLLGSENDPLPTLDMHGQALELTYARKMSDWLTLGFSFDPWSSMDATFHSEDGPATKGTVRNNFEGRFGALLSPIDGLRFGGVYGYINEALTTRALPASPLPELATVHATQHTHIAGGGASYSPWNGTTIFGSWIHYWFEEPLHLGIDTNYFGLSQVLADWLIVQGGYMDKGAYGGADIIVPIDGFTADLGVTYTWHSFEDNDALFGHSDTAYAYLNISF